MRAMKKLLSLPIRFYRRFISPLKPPCCKYYPTCSAYALDALKKHGAVKGSVLSVWRIMRCNPFSKGGEDKVPDEFFLYTLKSRRIREIKKQLKEYEKENSHKRIR